MVPQAVVAIETWKKDFVKYLLDKLSTSTHSDEKCDVFVQKMEIELDGNFPPFFQKNIT